MSPLKFRPIFAVTAATLLASAVLAADTEIPPIPEIPLDRITFTGTGYPQIPGDVQALIDKREDIWEMMHKAALAKAMPEIEKWNNQGRPYLTVARRAADLPKADIPAFPGAEGGGMYTAGGRVNNGAGTSKIFIVSNLNDSGPGSFREACEAGGPRFVLFNVAGIINLKTPLAILSPYITIAGQTAPGDGICVAGQSTHLRTHDIVIRYVRFRRGITDISSRDDTLSGDSIGNVIIDHVSASWGLDETLSNYRQMYAEDPADYRKRQRLSTFNLTVQNCIITETLDTYHHGFGSTLGGINTGFHHNLWASCTGRNASIGAGGDFNFVNNVIFNWRHRTLDGGGGVINCINNYYKPGPVTDRGQLQYRIGKPEGGRWYVSGNYVFGNEQVTADNWNGGIQQETPAPTTAPAGRNRGNPRLTEAGPMPPITVQPALEAFETVLASAGASLPKRDSVDARAVRQTRTGQVDYTEGKGIITDIKQVGGYPEYKGTPFTFRHNDGIPDDWKTKYKLNLADPDLATKDSDGDGYVNLEEYLNGTDPTQKVDYRDLKNNVSSLKPNI